MTYQSNKAINKFVYVNDFVFESDTLENAREGDTSGKTVNISDEEMPEHDDCKCSEGVFPHTVLCCFKHFLAYTGYAYLNKPIMDMLYMAYLHGSELPAGMDFNDN